VNFDFEPFVKLEFNFAINYMYNQILFMAFVVLTFFFIVEKGTFIFFFI